MSDPNATAGGGPTWTRWLVVAVPYAWLLVFFLAPFLIIFKISLSDYATAMPPYTPVVDSLTQQLTVDGPAATSQEEDRDEVSPFEKFDPLLHFGFTGGADDGSVAGRSNGKQSVSFIDRSSTSRRTSSSIGHPEVSAGPEPDCGRPLVARPTFRQHRSLVSKVDGTEKGRYIASTAH